MNLRALLCALLSAAPAGAVVIGIDFGARFLKVAAIKPGSGIEMVFDEASKRKQSASVAFNLEDERVLGDDAYNLAPRLPKRTYVYVKQVLGKALNSPAVAAMVRLGYPYAFELNATSRTLAVRQDATTTYLVEELGAFILSYAKKISEAHVGSTVRDCVITVPPYWKVSERLALLRAAEIAGLNVLSLLHETTAVAFKYGFDKEALFAEKPLNVVFYDLGAASYKVSVVEFASTVNKKNKTTGQLTVKGVAWDEGLGGQDFDACVADYLVDSFVKAHPKQGKTLRASERGMAKIRKEAERIKETLSANAEIPVAIEALHEDVDFRMVMNRAEFEKRCDSLWKRFDKPLDDALAQAGLTVAQIDKVEIVGGATRIPRVKQIALAYFKREQLDMSLNGDEACALGAALFAAKMSTSFRLREFGVVDLFPHEIKVRMGGDGALFDAEAEGEDGAAPSASAKEKVLFKKGAKFPHKKMLTVSRDADFVVEALLGGEPMATLNISGISSGLAGVKTAKREPVGKPRASVTFALSTSGLLEIAKAEVSLDVLETYDEFVAANETDADSANATANASTASAAAEGAEADAAGKEGGERAEAEAPAEAEAETEAGAGAAEPKAKAEDAEAEAEAAAEEGKAEADAAKDAPPKEAKGGSKGKESAKPAAKPAPKKVKVTKTAKRVHHVALKSASVYTTAVPPINATVVADAIARNQRMLEAEERRRVDAESKNRLEAYILSTRDKFGEDEAVAAVSTEAQRSELLLLFDQVEEWLYEEGRSVRHDAYDAKSVTLHALGDPIFGRVSELEARPAAVTSAREALEVATATVATWASEKPQITEEESAKTLELAANLTSWLDGVLAEQEGKAGHEEPAFTSAQLEKRLAAVDKAVRILGKKPKPKPVAKNATATAASNGTASAEAADADGKAGGEGEAKAKEEGEDKPADSEGEGKKDEL